VLFENRDQSTEQSGRVFLEKNQIMEYDTYPITLGFSKNISLHILNNCELRFEQRVLYTDQEDPEKIKEAFPGQVIKFWTLNVINFKEHFVVTSLKD
jgi:hypothetical protein